MSDDLKDVKKELEDFAERRNEELNQEIHKRQTETEQMLREAKLKEAQDKSRNKG